MTKPLKCAILFLVLNNGKLYVYAHSDITAEHFPAKDTGRAEVALELVHLNRTATADETLAYLEKNGLRPATPPELLAFGEKYPDIQRKFPVVALGSVWQDPYGDRRVAYLWDAYGERRLGLGWYGDDWSDDYRFLAVRK